MTGSTKGKKNKKKPQPAGISKLFGILGPGLTTGAADDDPSGIATYTQTGTRFGYALLWTALYMLPMMIAVQEACARIGLIKGKGLAAVIREKYNHKILYSTVVLVLIANTINIGADIGAMAAAAALIVPLPAVVLIIGFAAMILMLEVFVSYRQYSKILKWFSLALLAYPLTVLITHHPWREVLYASLIPQFSVGTEFFFIIVGVLGTTISPYMFFWQASQEVEESKARQGEDRKLVSGSKESLRRMRIDTFIGMGLSELTTWSIILVSATVLHGAGLHSISSAADAARALEPLVSTFPYSGLLAKLIFSLGVVGLGMLAVPVLAGSAAYALTEATGTNSGLSNTPKQAPAFYSVIIISTIIGIFQGILVPDPVTSLLYAAVINGIVAVPLLLLIIRISSDKAIMGVHTNGKISSFLLWTTLILMTAAAAALFIGYQ